MSSSSFWFVDVKAWEPSSPLWRRAMQALPLEEQEKVQRFMFVKDQRLALASRLLQRCLIQDTFQVPWHEVVIARTPEGKPYWVRGPAQQRKSAPLWNYNVSHHGTVVAIASHSHGLVGVDVMQLSERPRTRKQTVLKATPEQELANDFFRAFEGHFTALEWAYIRRGAPNVTTQFHAFYHIWSLKEAYIKAVGMGLGACDLQRTEFLAKPSRDINDGSIDESTGWQLRLNGEVASQWRFHSSRVGGNGEEQAKDKQDDGGGDAHVVTVGMGPVAAMWRPQSSNILPHTSVTAMAPALHGTANTTADQEENKTLAPVWKLRTLEELIDSIPATITSSFAPRQ